MAPGLLTPRPRQKGAWAVCTAARGSGFLLHVSGSRAGSWAATRCPPSLYPGSQTRRSGGGERSSAPNPHDVLWVREPRWKGAESRQSPPESGDLGFLSSSLYFASNWPKGASQSNPAPSCVLRGAVHTRPRPSSRPAPSTQPGPRKRHPTTGSRGTWLSLRSDTSYMNTQREVSARSSPR